jgi:Chaperone of endosialidase
MSYKQNQEKMTVSSTGTVTSSTNAVTSTKLESSESTSFASGYFSTSNFISTESNQFRPWGTGNALVYNKSLTIADEVSAAGNEVVTQLILQASSWADVDNDYSASSASIGSYGGRLDLGANRSFNYTTGGFSFSNGNNVITLHCATGGLIAFSPATTATTENIRVQINNTSPYAAKLGGGVWGTISDSRLKTNVRKLGSALDKIDALQPVHFEFINFGENANPSGTRTGFIAQEFEQVLPGHTFEMEPMAEADKALLGEGVKAKGIDADLVPYLVKAIQELKAELDTVKAELATLKG